MSENENIDCIFEDTTILGILLTVSRLDKLSSNINFYRKIKNFECNILRQMLLFLNLITSLRTFYTLESILFVYMIQYFYTSSTINPASYPIEKIVFSRAQRIERTSEISIFQFLSRNLILTAISRLPSPSYHLTPATHSRTYLSSNPPRLSA